MGTVWRFLLLMLGLLLVNGSLTVRHDNFAIPITVALEGFSEQEFAGTRLRMIGLGSDDLVAPTRPGYWECPPRCTVQLYIVFKEALPDHKGNVRVNIGEREFALPLRELPSDGAAYWLPNSVVYAPPPAFAMCRNWPGMQPFLGHLLVRSLPGLLTVLILVLAVWIGMSDPFRARFTSIFGFTESASTATTGDFANRFWNLIGWAFLIGGFAFLQCLEPYYFTQDDALIGELPGILLGCC